MLKSNYLYLIGIILISGLLVSCDKDSDIGSSSDDDKKVDFTFLIGKWEYIYDDDVKKYVTFGDDGNYSVELVDGTSHSIPGTYSYNGKKGEIYITLQGEKEPTTYKVCLLTESELELAVVEDINFGNTEIYTKVSPDSSIDNTDDRVSLSTPVVDDITTSSALIKGTILGDDVEFAERGICFSTSPKPTIENKIVRVSTDIVNMQLTDLFQGTVYYIRLYAKVGNKISYSQQVSFKTKGVSTSKILFDAVQFAPNEIRLSVKLPNDINKFGICYGTLPHPKITDKYISERTRTEWESYRYVTIANLEKGMTYYFRAYHIEGTEIIYYDNSEISAETIGKTIILNPEFNYKSINYYPKPTVLTSNISSVKFKVSYKNLPQGTYEASLKISNVNGIYEQATKYLDNTTNLWELDHSIMHVFDNSSIVLTFRNINTEVIFEVRSTFIMDENNKIIDCDFFEIIKQ